MNATSLSPLYANDPLLGNPQCLCCDCRDWSGDDGLCDECRAGDSLESNAYAGEIRNHLIERIVANLAADRAKHRGKPVERTMFTSPDGRRFTMFGVPLGMNVDACTREPYWCLQLKNGTTHGKQHPSREALDEATAAVEREHRLRDRRMCEAMDDQRLAGFAQCALRIDGESVLAALVADAE